MARTDAKAAAAGAQLRREPGWFDVTRGHLMTVCACLIVLGINGIVNPPGGRYSDDMYKYPNGINFTYPHQSGEPVIAIHRQRAYVFYTVECTLVFIFSWFMIMVLVMGFPWDSGFYMFLLVALMFFMMFLMVNIFYHNLMSCIAPTGEKMKDFLMVTFIVYIILGLLALALAVTFVGFLIKETYYGKKTAE